MAAGGVHASSSARAPLTNTLCKRRRPAAPHPYLQLSAAGGPRVGGHTCRCRPEPMRPRNGPTMAWEAPPGSAVCQRRSSSGQDPVAVPPRHAPVVQSERRRPRPALRSGPAGGGAQQPAGASGAAVRCGAGRAPGSSRRRPRFGTCSLIQTQCRKPNGSRSLDKLFDCVGDCDDSRVNALAARRVIEWASVRHNPTCRFKTLLVLRLGCVHDASAPGPLDDTWGPG